MSAFREKIPMKAEVEGFFKQQGTGSTIQSNDTEQRLPLYVVPRYMSMGQFIHILSDRCTLSIKPFIYTHVFLFIKKDFKTLLVSSMLIC